MPEQFVPLDFPLAGLDVSCAFDMQPVGTSADAVNVRAFEPTTQRGRGGSRNGLSHSLPRLPGGSHLVQHLNVIVDPTVDALLDNFDDPDGDDDPSSDGSGNPLDGSGGNSGRNPGRKVRHGGSGRSSSRNKPALTPLVQQFSSGMEASQPSLAATFTNPVAANNLLVVLAVTRNDPVAGTPTGQTVTISDSLGQSWLQAGGYARVVVSGSSPATEHALSAWYAVTTQSGAEKITMTPSSKAYVGLSLYEFKGMKSSAGAAFDAVSTGSAQAVVGSPMTCGSVGVAIAGDLVVAAIVEDGPNILPNRFQPPGLFSGFKTLASAGSGNGDGPNGSGVGTLFAGYKSPVNSSVTPSLNSGGMATDYCAIGLSFKKK